MRIARRVVFAVGALEMRNATGALALCCSESDPESPKRRAFAAAFCDSDDCGTIIRAPIRVAREGTLVAGVGAAEGLLYSGEDFHRRYNILLYS